MAPSDTSQRTTSPDRRESGSAASARGLPLPAVAAMVAGMVAFGSAAPVSQVVGRSFPVWLGSSARIVLAAAALAPFVVLRRRRDGGPGLAEVIRSLSRGDRWRLAALALIGTFAFSALMLLGMRETTGAVAAVVMATTPAVTAIASVVFLGERLTPARGIALALAVAGVLLVNLFGGVGESPGGRVVLGSVLVFGAVCCEATYTLVGRSLSTDLDPPTMTLLAALVAAASFAPFAVWDLVGFDWSAPSGAEWLGLLWWGAGTMALGSVLWFLGVRRVPGTTASVFMAVMPVSALVLSYVLLGDAVRWVHVAGMALVLVGLGVVTLRDGAG